MEETRNSPPSGDILWEGRMSASYKKYESIIITSIVFVYWIILYSLTTFGGPFDFPFFFVISTLLLFSVSFIPYYFWKYLWKAPLYQITSEQLIKRDRHLYGKWKIKSMDLSKINTIYIVKSKFSKYTFFFLQNSIEEIIQKHPAPFRQIVRVLSSIGNTIRGRSKENLIKSMNFSAENVSDWDYRTFKQILPLIRPQTLFFDSVDFPKPLFSAIRSLIQLKKHPIIPNPYIQDN